MMNYPIEIKKPEIINSTTTSHQITTRLNPFLSKPFLDTNPKIDDIICSSYNSNTDNDKTHFFNALPQERKDFAYLTSQDKNFNSLPSLNNKSAGFTFEHFGNVEPQSKLAQINLNEATIRPDLETNSFQLHNEKNFKYEVKMPAKTEQSITNNVNILDFCLKDEQKFKDKFEAYTVPEKKKEEKYDFFDKNEGFSTALNLKANSFDEYNKIIQAKKEEIESLAESPNLTRKILPALFGNSQSSIDSLKKILPPLFSKENVINLTKIDQDESKTSSENQECLNFSPQKKNQLPLVILSTPKIKINGIRFTANVENIFDSNENLRNSVDLSNSEYKKRSKVSIITEEREDFGIQKFINEPKTISSMENDKFKNYEKKEESKTNDFEKEFKFSPAQEWNLANPLQDRLLVRNHWKMENFDMGNILGRGKFSNVYLARDKQTNFLVALKIIKKAILKECEAEQALAQEIKIQHFCSHPNILKLYGYIDEDDKIILIQEYATHGDLYKELKNQFDNKFSEHQAASYVRQILEGLNYLHNNNIIHRDIKPENVMISFGVLKISDFGWAHFNPPNERRNTFCGTLDYVAPEIVEGTPYDKQVDLWSLGVLCYELCEGQPPFAHESTSETYLNIINVKMDFPLHFSDELQDLLYKVLKKSPSQRLSVKDLINHPWIVNNSMKDLSNQQGFGASRITDLL